MKFEQHIAKLLENHDCVIVPDFGGFIGNYQPARVDEVQNMIYPPSKTILFNSNLTTNDGLLGNQISQTEQLTYDQAIELIREKIREWRVILNEGGRIEIEELGFLYSQHDRVIFEQSREVNLLLSAYGLAPVKVIHTPSVEEKVEPVVEVQVEKKKEIEVPKLEVVEEAPVEKEVVQPKEEKPIIVEKHEEKETIVLDLRKDSKITEEKEAEPQAEAEVIQLPRKRRGLKFALVAACLPIAFYSYWIPMQTDFLDTGSIQITDFNPTHSQADRTYEKRDAHFEIPETVEFESWEALTEKLTNVSVYNYQFDEDLYIPVRLDNEVSDSEDILSVNESTDVVETETNTVDETNETSSSSSAPYHVITGCFSVKANADGLVQELQEAGYDAMILDQNNGLHRVTAGGFSDRDDAKSSQSKLEGQGYSSWVLKQ